MQNKTTVQEKLSALYASNRITVQSFFLIALLVVTFFITLSSSIYATWLESTTIVWKMIGYVVVIKGAFALYSWSMRYQDEGIKAPILMLVVGCSYANITTVFGWMRWWLEYLFS